MHIMQSSNLCMRDHWDWEAHSILSLDWYIVSRFRDSSYLHILYIDKPHAMSQSKSQSNPKGKGNLASGLSLKSVGPVADDGVGWEGEDTTPGVKQIIVSITVPWGSQNWDNHKAKKQKYFTAMQEQNSKFKSINSINLCEIKDPKQNVLPSQTSLLIMFQSAVIILSYLMTETEVHVSWKAHQKPLWDRSAIFDCWSWFFCLSSLISLFIFEITDFCSWILWLSLPVSFSIVFLKSSSSFSSVFSFYRSFLIIFLLTFPFQAAYIVHSFSLKQLNGNLDLQWELNSD